MPSCNETMQRFGSKNGSHDGDDSSFDLRVPEPFIQSDESAAQERVLETIQANIRALRSDVRSLERIIKGYAIPNDAGIKGAMIDQVYRAVRRTLNS